MNKNTSTRTGMEIAVIGMAGKFPKADNLEKYWNNLKEGKDCITFFSDDELCLSKDEEILKKNPCYVKAKGYLEGKEYFDEKFFGYTKSDVQVMEPQMRLFHECVWSALEDAGQNVKKESQIGLYGGASADTYWKLVTKLQTMGDNLKSFSDEQLTNEEFMCTKIAFKLNLKGPAVYVKTACSTSAAAIHMACRSLLTGECKVAVAGGVSLLLPDKKGYLYREGMIFSPDGHCKAFDDDAHGTVGGEGAGAVVLKKLRDAQADGDRIYAVIKGSAMNNDGAERMGYTAPGVTGQASVIRKAHRLAKVLPDTISYIEAHGTGTELGDPIEVEALQEAFASTSKQVCAIGSVKSNIGHLDSASGVAGFIKTVLALYYKEIPPTIHYQKPNRKINFENSPFFVNSTLRKWEPLQGFYRAGVSSFGMGGTNVHIVLENYEYEKTQKKNGYNLLTFSAKSPGALERMLMEWKEYLIKNKEADIEKIAWLLGKKRSRFAFRKAIGCSSASDAVKRMESIQPEHIKNSLKMSGKTVFMFPGQGKQYVKMAYGLYEKNQVMKEIVDQCFSIYSRYDQGQTKNVWLQGTVEDIKKTSISQPLIFMIEYSIAKLLMHHGVNPDIVMGYSLGEYVAACIAGVFSLEDALYMVHVRGKLMEQTKKGVMLSVPLDKAKTEVILEECKDISIAVDNGDSCIVAGSLDAVETCEEILRNNKIVSMRIGVDYACHSHLMEPILFEYEEKLKQVTFQVNTIPMLSCVTGSYVKENEITKVGYWSTHITKCVNFYKAVKTLSASGEKHILVEVGSGRDLLAMASRTIAKENVLCGIDTIRIQGRDLDDEKFFYDKLGILYDNGVELKHMYDTEDNVYDIGICPLYPFEKNAFSKELFTSQALDLRKEGIQQVKENQIYIQNWIRTSKKDLKESAGRKWIIFSDNHPMAEKVVAKIAQKDTICAQIASKDFYQAEEKLTALFQQGENYSMLFAYSLDCQEEAQEAYCNKLFRIAQLYGAAGSTANLLLYIVSSNACEAIGCDLKYPEKAILSAAVHVIPQEYVNIKVKLIDLDEAEFQNGDGLALSVLKECNEDYTETMVAYRRNYRMIPTYTIVDEENQESYIKENGVYILFGGLGGIGQAVAEFLKQKYHARLVLAGRKANESSINSPLLMEEMGCEYISCDIADADKVQELFAYVKNKFGCVDGAFNMTAVADGCLIQMRKPEDTKKVMEPKYIGTENLIEACRQFNTKLLVLFSSFSSITGGVGQAAYCAANAYMDACSYYNENVHGIRTICIDWDRWKHMGISNKLEKIHFELTGSIMEDGLDAQSGIALLERCLKMDYPHFIALSANIESFFVQGNVEQDVVQEQKELAALDRSSLSTEYEAPESETQKELVEFWEQQLLIGPIGIQDDFLELGGDSLKAIIMLAKIEKIFHKKVLVATFLADPTISRLTELLQEAVVEEEEKKTGKYLEELDDKAKAYLEKISNTDEIEDAYYLSQMQNMTLAYNIMHQADGKNVSMFECVIRGSIEINDFTKAWHQVVIHHPVLRSTIAWRRLPEPLQVIRKDAKDNVQVLDYSHLDDVAFLKELDKIRTCNLEKGFKVTEYPLFRFYIMKRSETQYNLMIFYLNSLFDGWSTSILLRDIKNYYSQLRLGEQIKADNEKTGHYLASLKMQRNRSKQKAEDFWKQEFLGYDFWHNKMEKLDILTDTTYYEQKIVIDSMNTDRIYQYTKDKRITMNSYLQGCYAILLSVMEQQKDVVTGYVSAGRDSFTDDMLNNVGLFTNIIPVRTAVEDSFLTEKYFINVHKHVNRINQNSFLKLSEIESLTNAPKDFFEQISYGRTLTAIQYPGSKGTDEDFKVEDVVSNTSVNVPLRTYVQIGDTLQIKIQYWDLYEDQAMEQMLNRFKKIVERGIENTTIGELKNS